MSNKFEKLLDLLVNEEMDQANALFHEIVVEKSREIYENLIAEEAEDDDTMEEDSDQEDESVEEDTDEDESVEEGFMGQDDESVYEIGGEGNEMPPQDPSDDMLDAVSSDDEMGDEFGGDDMGDDMDGSSEPATKADIQDIKMDIDQDFAEIKAAFQQMIDGTSPDDEMGDEFGDDEMGDDDFGDEEGDDEFGGEEDDGEEDDSEDDSEEKAAEEAFMREYREVVGKPYAGGKVAGKSEEGGANTKSVGLQNPARLSDGKVSAGNIAQSAAGADKKPGVGGVLKSGGKFTGSGTHNVDGVKSGIKTVKKVPAGHGAEKKGGSAGPVGSGKGDKAGQTDVKKIPQFLKPAK
jgi:hypothetical protein